MPRDPLLLPVPGSLVGASHSLFPSQPPEGTLKTKPDLTVMPLLTTPKPSPFPFVHSVLAPQASLGSSSPANSIPPQGLCTCCGLCHVHCSPWPALHPVSSYSLPPRSPPSTVPTLLDSLMAPSTRIFVASTTAVIIPMSCL